MCVCIFFFSCIILSLLIYLSICQISLKKREENLFYHANIIKGLKVIIVKIKIEKRGGGGVKILLHIKVVRIKFFM